MQNWKENKPVLIKPVSLVMLQRVEHNDPCDAGYLKAATSPAAAEKGRKKLLQAVHI